MAGRKRKLIGEFVPPLWLSSDADSDEDQSFQPNRLRLDVQNHRDPPRDTPDPSITAGTSQMVIITFLKNKIYKKYSDA